MEHPFKKEISSFSQAVRESSLKRLRVVPEGKENWRIDPEAMSFADTAQHLIDCDRWLFRTLTVMQHGRMDGRAHLLDVTDRKDYDTKLEELRIVGEERGSVLASLTPEQMAQRIPSEVFGGEVTIWWTIMRGNIDHEIHHRGQLVAYLRASRIGSID